MNFVIGFVIWLVAVAFILMFFTGAKEKQPYYCYHCEKEIPVEAVLLQKGMCRECYEMDRRMELWKREKLNNKF